MKSGENSLSGLCPYLFPERGKDQEGKHCLKQLSVREWCLKGMKLEADAGQSNNKKV